MSKSLREQLEKSLAEAYAISRRHSNGSGADVLAFDAVSRLIRALNLAILRCSDKRGVDATGKPSTKAEPMSNFARKFDKAK